MHRQRSSKPIIPISTKTARAFLLVGICPPLQLALTQATNLRRSDLGLTGLKRSRLTSSRFKNGRFWQADEDRCETITHMRNHSSLKTRDATKIALA